MALTKVTGQVINTSTDVTVGVLTVTNTLAVGGTVSIGGTLTYEDVTNIDSVGLITARNGIVVGSGITLSKDGDGFFTGVTTTSSLVSSGAISGTTGTFTGDVDIADTIVHTGDTNTKIRFPAADTITAETGGSERLRITSDGKIGVNENSPGQRLTVGGDIQIGFNTPSDAARQIIFNTNRGSAADTLANINWQWNSKNVAQIRGIAGADTSNKDDGHLTFYTSAANSLVERLRIDSSGNMGLGIGGAISDARFRIKGVNNSTSTFNDGLMVTSLNETVYKKYSWSGIETKGGLVFHEATSSYGETMRIDTSGRLLVGTTVTPTQSGSINVFGTDQEKSTVSIRRGSADGNGPRLHFQKSRNTTDGSHTVVQNDDVLGQIVFAGNDGQGPENGARISAEVDHTAGGNDMPTRLVFAVTPNGSDTLAEIVKIREDGRIDLGVSGPSSRIDPTSSGELYIEADPNSNYGSSNIRFKIDGNESARMAAGTHAFFGLGRTSSQSNARCDIQSQSDQDVLFLTQSQNDTTNRNLVLLHTGAQSGFAVQVAFMDNAGGIRGTIKNNTSSTQYNTSSDYRLKENEVEISDGIERIKQLKPYRFNWKNRPDTIVDGFFAHEVQDIIEDCVDGTKDEVYTEDNDELKIKAGDPKYQQMDHSKLVPLLTAALKETITEIETLKAEVAALKSN